MLKRVMLVLIILCVVFLVYRSQDLYRQYKDEVLASLERTREVEAPIVTEDDIAHLPEPVQKYLRYVGVVGKERVKGFRVIINGSMKFDKDKDWVEMPMQQYSFLDEITRLFFLRTKMFGLPVLGLHSYTDTNATMLIKVAGLIPVVDGKGEEMDQGETVTMFNDMCILAPATLIDERIEWASIDSLTAKAIFNNQGVKISATLHFNEEGQLINFVSDDRYYSPRGKTYERVRWSTPISNYKSINGFTLPTYGEAIWKFPEGDYCYAKLTIKDLEYNPKSLQE